MDYEKITELQKYLYEGIIQRKFDKDKELRIKKTRDFIKGLVNKKILDLGGGNGNILEPLIHTNECYVGDISETLLKEAALKGIKTYLVNIEKEKLSFKANSFDAVLCLHVLEHVVDTDF
ncbi:unnamed protein product [marine sediment metagenome]|uniref:Methyltransferase type 11 domain-containing protein n=1 Tax=marine sediment metagenome TaxID=412755 RepID=X1HVN7_9ZZZZ